MLTMQSGENFSVACAGAFNELGRYVFDLPTAPRAIAGKLFLKQTLGLTGAEISLNHLPAHTSIPFYHKHQLNEEIYIFVGGKGEFQVDDCVFSVAEGTVVKVDPDGSRCMRSVTDEGLSYVTIQVRAGSHSGRTIDDGTGLPLRVSWKGKQEVEL